MTRAPYTWLFFDADDTLFDFPASERRALQKAFADAGLPYDPAVEPAYHQINQELWKDLEQGRVGPVELRWLRFDRLFADFSLQADAGAFGRLYLKRLAEGSLLLPGAAELVRRLAGSYRLGLVTNGLPEVQRPRLGASGIGECFSFAAISEEVGAAKPDGRFFEAALALAGSPPRREVLVIGDSLSSDIRGGFQAGLDTLWYNPAGLPPDPRWPAVYEARTLDEIADMLA